MRLTSERGAMVIIVAVALLALTALSAFVLDNGVLWVARGQAQAAADAGALAAANHLYWDDATDFAGAQTQARLIANSNAVWGENPRTADILVTVPLVCPPGVGGGTCVKVDVQRGATDVNGGLHANVLPTFFANLIGIHEQRIMATATAQLAGANASDCLRPWFVVNKPGAGYTTDDIGTSFVLDSSVDPSGYGKIDIANGEDGVVDAIKGCARDPELSVGDDVGTQTGAAGHRTTDAVNTVISWDPGAHYNPATKRIEGSCAPNCYCDGLVCPNASKGVSPRVFVAPICNPDPLTDPGCVSGGSGSTHSIDIVNFLSFFVVPTATSHGNDIYIPAILVGAAGDINPNAGPAPSAFLQIVRLVR